MSIERILSSAYGKAMCIFFTEVSGKEKNRQSPQPACLLVVMSWHCKSSKSSSSLDLLFWEMRWERVPALPSAPWGEGHFQINALLSLLCFFLYIGEGLTIYSYMPHFPEEHPFTHTLTLNSQFWNADLYLKDWCYFYQKGIWMQGSRLWLVP